MPRRSSGSTFQIDTGLDIGPFLTKSLIEAIEPKGTRKQRQEQEALAKLAELQPMVSKLPETEKKDFYNRFFQAYGVYKAPWIRGMFGAGEEPILPLPTGAQEITRPMTGMFGKRDVKGVYIPKIEPFTFPREELPPLMPPSKVKELKSFGLTDEDIRDLLKEQPSQLKMVLSASRLYTQAKQQGKSHEEALNALGELRAPYEDYLQDRQLKKQQIEAGITAKGEAAYIQREREKRLTEEGKVKKAYMEGQIELRRRQETRISKNADLARQAKTQQDLLSLAQKAFAEDRRAAISQNRLELDKAVKAQMMGETYLRNEVTIPLDFDDWLANDGRAFQERFKQMGGGEGGAPGGVPPIIDKKKAFGQKWGLMD
jgi:hypothetical protein